MTTSEQIPATSESEVEAFVSVVIPCLNEEGNIERCVHDALAALENYWGKTGR